MTVKVFYKYVVSQSFFEETYTGLTAEQANKIKERYCDNMKNGDYIALFIETDNE